MNFDTDSTPYFHIVLVKPTRTHKENHTQHIILHPKTAKELNKASVQLTNITEPSSELSKEVGLGIRGVLNINNCK